MKITVVGCGLSGAVAARLLKDKGHSVEIFDCRNHIGGNCYDSNMYGVMVHNYGPHIFHTNDDKVFEFTKRYTDWFDFEYKPKGNTRLGFISLPYSKKTIKELGRPLSAEEIKEYIFKDYSEKQWGIPIEQLPQSILNRVPDTANEEDPTWYKNQKYQCLPKRGYTKMFEEMISGISVNLDVQKNEWKKYNADLIIYTGKIDEFYNYQFGRLPYRSLNFIHTPTPHRMNNVVIHENNRKVEHTRTYDHGYFTYGYNGSSTVLTKEYPIDHTESNIPFYPMPIATPYNKYKELTNVERNTIFLGRLATYKYLDMAVAIKQSLIQLKNV